MKKLSLFLTLIHLSFLVGAQAGFIENKGQIIDQHGQPNPNALFVLSLQGMNVILRPDGFSYDVYEVRDTKLPQSTIADQLKMGLEITPSQPEKIRVHRVDVVFESMNADVQIDKLNQVGSATYNYYTTGTPNEGIHDVRQFSKIVYRSVYDGIDIEFTASKEKGFEYNFIVQAGADMGQLSMEYKGPEAMRLNENKLHLSLSTNDLIESIPSSFLQGSKNPIDVKYSLKQNTLRFVTSGNQLNETLVIDPTPNLVYATYFGGPAKDMVTASELDIEGNLYLAGHTASTENIASNGAFQSEISGEEDVFLFKFSPTNTLIWATYFGGHGNEECPTLHLIDEAVILAGFSGSSTGMASIGAFQQSLSGDLHINAFIAKFNQLGSRVWSSYFGTSVEGFSEVILLNNNTLVAVGFTQSLSLPFSVNPFQANLNGAKDAFISQWDLDGNPLYCSYFGGEFTENFNDVIQDDNGLIWLSGSTRSSSGIATNNAFQQEYGGGISDLMLVGFTQDFELEFATYFGSSGDDYNSALDFANGKIYLSGQTTYGDLLTTAGAFQQTNFGGRDALFVIINDALEVEYCTLFGGEFGDDKFKTMIHENEMYFMGGTRSTENIALSGAYQQDFMDSGLDNIWKIFIGKMNTNNELLWCTYFGNYSNTRGANLHIHDGKLIVTGWSRSTADLPEEMQIPISTPDAFQTESAGEEDVFIAVFDSFTGIELENDFSDIALFPNPAGNVLNLSSNALIENVQLSNAVGQEIFTGNYNGRNVQIDIYNLAQGMYLCKIQHSDGVISTIKFMKD